MLFEPDQALDAVLAGEAGHHAFAVLVDALDQVRRDPGVERAVAARGHDVDARLKVALHAQSLLGSRFRGNDEGEEKRPFRPYSAESKRAVALASARSRISLR